MNQIFFQMKEFIKESEKILDEKENQSIICIKFTHQN